MPTNDHPTMENHVMTEQKKEAVHTPPAKAYLARIVERWGDDVWEHMMLIAEAPSDDDAEQYANDAAPDFGRYVERGSDVFVESVKEIPVEHCVVLKAYLPWETYEPRRIPSENPDQCKWNSGDDAFRYDRNGKQCREEIAFCTQCKVFQNSCVEHQDDECGACRKSGHLVPMSEAHSNRPRGPPPDEVERLREEQLRQQPVADFLATLGAVEP